VSSATCQRGLGCACATTVASKPAFCHSTAHRTTHCQVSFTSPRSLCQGSPLAATHRCPLHPPPLLCCAVVGGCGRVGVASTVALGFGVEDSARRLTCPRMPPHCVHTNAGNPAPTSWHHFSTPTRSTRPLQPPLAPPLLWRRHRIASAQSGSVPPPALAAGRVWLRFVAGRDMHVRRGSQKSR
jgi:hypothetical protein